MNRIVEPMSRLTPEGRRMLGELSARHGVSAEAGLVLLDGLSRGGGSMAQFDHPELGGSGQWMAGGMVMIGDMFNQGLKYRVDALCRDLGSLLASGPYLPPPSAQPGVASLSFGGSWWPAGLGQPDWSGGQNQMRYAFFAAAHRLAIDLNGEISIYDTSGFHLTGVGQQQSSGSPSNLTFTGPGGTVTVDRLRRLDQISAASAPTAESTPDPIRSEVAKPHDGPVPAPVSVPGSQTTIAPAGPAFDDSLGGTTWVFGPVGGAGLATLTLKADGSVDGGGADCRYWAVEEGALWLYARDGRATARFDRAEANGDLVGTSPPGTGDAWRLSRPQPTAAAAANPAPGAALLTLRLDLGAEDWRFGERGGEATTRLHLLPDGRIEGGARATEAAWRLEGEELVFLHRSGRPTTRFNTIEIRNGRWTLSGTSLANPNITHELRQV